MTQRNFLEAINNALDEEMERDPRVMVLGLDVGKLGGVFRATSGLLERHGPDRVVDTPLAEASIIGASLGLAISGMVPVAEINFWASRPRLSTRSGHSWPDTACAPTAGITARSRSVRRSAAASAAPSSIQTPWRLSSSSRQGSRS